MATYLITYIAHAEVEVEADSREEAEDIAFHSDLPDFEIDEIFAERID